MGPIEVVDDGRQTGLGMVVRFAFVPKSVDPLDSAVKIAEKEIVFLDAIAPERQFRVISLAFRRTHQTTTTFTVEDTNRHVGMQQTSDTPLSRIYFWSNSRVVCPEAYIHLGILSGKTGRRKIHYRFLLWHSSNKVLILLDELQKIYGTRFADYIFSLLIMRTRSYVVILISQLLTCRWLGPSQASSIRLFWLATF